jgi:nitronate monooxygenase
MSRVSALRELLGVEFPLVQAPMAGAQTSPLALAVSSVGALGSLPGAMLSPSDLRRELVTLEAGTRPYSVNFFCHTPPVPNPEREARFRKALAPYFAEYGIDADRIPAGPGRTPFSAEVADVLQEFRPKVVSFHFGLPAPELLERVRSWGSKILSSATTLKEALWLEERGVDAVIAQGLEAGGHRGSFLSEDMSTQVGTFALVRQLSRQMKVPVIAAGGIADAEGIRAALALGASGVQVGTAYLLCPEVTTSALHRAALKSEAARETALTNLFTGRPARGIVNRLMRELGPLSAAPPPFPLATTAIAALRSRAEAQAKTDFSPLWAGQNVTGCRETPAAELTRELVSAF